MREEKQRARQEEGEKEREIGLEEEVGGRKGERREFGYEKWGAERRHAPDGVMEER